MRTTVTIDPDTEALLKEEIRRTGLSFKEVLNRSVRQAMGAQRMEKGSFRIEPLFSAPFPVEMEGRSFNRLAYEWDDRRTLEELNS